MKAAIYESFNEEISIQNVPIPKLQHSNGVLIQLMATGVCRSDWHGWKGHDGDIKKHGLPFIPGHEFSGVIVATGNDVKKFRPGDRVAVPFILSCGSCHYCSTEKRPTICARQEQPGFTQLGSFAEYVAIPRADRNLCHLPSNVSFIQAAALGCRFTTAYRAVIQQGKLQAGQTIAVFGCGGLGLSCIMMAKSKGAKIIIAVDISFSALEKAKALGATHLVLNSKTQKQDPQTIASEVNKHTTFEGGAHVTIDAAGFLATSEAAVYATRPGGRMVQVGLPFGLAQIPMTMVAGREIEIVGSHGFDAKALPDLLHLVATDPTMDPSLLVERCVSLEEGTRALMEMDKQSPLGIVMITNFNDSSSSRL